MNTKSCFLDELTCFFSAKFEALHAIIIFLIHAVIFFQNSSLESGKEDTSIRSTNYQSRYCPVLVAQEGSALWGNTLASALLHDQNQTIPFELIQHGSNECFIFKEKFPVLCEKIFNN